MNQRETDENLQREVRRVIFHLEATRTSSYGVFSVYGGDPLQWVEQAAQRLTPPAGFRFADDADGHPVHEGRGHCASGVIVRAPR